MYDIYFHFLSTEKTCPQGEIYQFETKMYQPSCANPQPQISHLIEGCVCRKGYLLSGKKCVLESECGCFNKGYYMEVSRY